MKLEIIDITPDEQRVLLLFDNQAGETEHQQIDAYLKSNGLEPKRQYVENREDKEYLVYYFGHCYLGDHVDKLSSMARET